MKIKLLLFFAFLIVLNSCSTNNFAKFSVKGTKVYYDAKTTPQAVDVRVSYDQPAPKDDKDKNKDNKSKENTQKTDNNNNNDNKDKKSTVAKVVDVVSDIAVNVGESLAESSLENKLRNAVKKVNIPDIISSNVQKTMFQYLNTSSTKRIDDDYVYICETIINNATITSTSTSMQLNVTAITKITKRETGEVVWKNSESQAVQLRNRYLGNNSTVAKTTQTLELALTSEETLMNAIEDATAVVAKKMTDTLLDDIRDAYSKK